MVSPNCTRYGVISATQARVNVCITNADCDSQELHLKLSSCMNHPPPLHLPPPTPNPSYSPPTHLRSDYTFLYIHTYTQQILCVYRPQEYWQVHTIPAEQLNLIMYIRVTQLVCAINLLLAENLIYIGLYGSYQNIIHILHAWGHCIWDVRKYLFQVHLPMGWGTY